LEVEGAGSIGEGAGILEEGKALEVVIGVFKLFSSSLPTLSMRMFKGSARKTPGGTFGPAMLME